MNPNHIAARSHTMVTHDLSYVEEVNREFQATVDYDGNIVVDRSTEEVVDYLDSHIYCSVCGLLGYDEYEDHGISEDWITL